MIRIGVIGDYNPESVAHRTTDAALQHGASSLGLNVEAPWISTSSVDAPVGDLLLEACDAILATPGSPYQSMVGMLRSIQFARTHDRPFLGTCGGFQYALLEYARNVLGLEDADTAENSSGSKNIIISPVVCGVPNRSGTDPKLVGAGRIHIEPESLLRSIFACDEAEEEYFCSFEMNADYEPRFQAAGLRISARGFQGEPRAFELPALSFYVATLFQPQRSSRPGRPHPIVVAFLEAAASRAYQRRHTAAG